MDPTTMTAAALLLALVEVMACLIPMRRAAGTDPAIVLRSE